MLEFIAIQIIAFFALFLYGSFFEWTLHRQVLHRKFPFLGYAYRSHQLEHHVEYKGDETFESSDPNVQDHGRFKAWDYLYLILFHIPICLAVEHLTGIFVAGGALFGVVAYTMCFDFLHYSFHVPRKRRYENHRWFQWLKHHHFVHHKNQNRNLNVVIPLADFVFGTKK